MLVVAVRARKGDTVDGAEESTTIAVAATVFRSF